jgi:ankyrin repeat protein
MDSLRDPRMVKAAKSCLVFLLTIWTAAPLFSDPLTREEWADLSLDGLRVLLSQEEETARTLDEKTDFWEDLIWEALYAENYPLVPAIMDGWSHSEAMLLRVSILAKIAEAPGDIFQATYRTWLEGVKKRTTDPEELRELQSAWLIQLSEQDRVPLEYLEFLLDQGAPVNAVDRKGRTGLFYLLERDHPRVSEAMNLFFSRGYDLNLKGRDGSTLLGYLLASQSTSKADYQAFKTAGGDTKALVYGGMEGWDFFFDSRHYPNFGIPEHPIHLAEEDYMGDPGPNTLLASGVYPFMRKDALAIVPLFDRLRAAGADYNLVDREGNTVYHWAARYFYPEVAAVLLDLSSAYPSLLNRQNNQGQTALHTAIAHTQFTYGLDLIERGIDQGLPDHQGWYALDYFHPERYESQTNLLFQLKEAPELHQSYLALPEWGDYLASVERDAQDMIDQELFWDEVYDKAGLGLWTLVLPGSYLAASIAHRDLGGSQQSSTFFSHSSAALTLGVSSSLLSFGLLLGGMGDTGSGYAGAYGAMGYGILSFFLASGIGITSGIVGGVLLGEEFNKNPVLYYLGPTMVCATGLIIFMLGWD